LIRKHSVNIIFFMHRLVLISVLFLLPLQASWAAAAYCGHEKGIASKHVGHHQHKHQAPSNDRSGDSPPGTSGIDKDCGICHINPNFLFSTAETSLHEDGKQVGQLPPCDLCSSFVPGEPERPKWRVLA